MRLCDLTDEQLKVEATRYRATTAWVLVSEGTRQNAKIIADVLDELVDRREAMSPMRMLEMSIAYEGAVGVINGLCNVPETADEDLEGWFDLDSTPADMDADDEAAYLESRHLLLHHPAHPRWVCIRDESEGD